MRARPRCSWLVGGTVVALVVCACGRGRNPESPSPVPVTPELSNDPQIVRGFGCALSGVIRESPGGAPAAGASIAIVKEPGGYSAPSIVSSTTDSGGTYQIGGIDCGISRRLRIQKADFFTLETSVLFDGDLRKDFTIERITYSLRGIVRDGASRTPIPDVTVEILSGPYSGRKTTSHLDGSYGLSARDTVTVRVSKTGYESQEATVTVAVPGADRDFSITRR